MASVQVFPAISGAVRRKRTLDDCGSASAASPAVDDAAVAKRRCRHATLDAVLRSDTHGFVRHSARRAALAERAVPDAAVASLLAGLGGDPDPLLRIVDLNVFAPRITALLVDYAARGAPLAALNVRAHAFSIARKDTVLASFANAYPHDRWLRDVVDFVAREFFPDDQNIALSVLSGGGIRDVLIADWCAMYKIGPAQVPPQLVIITAGSGRNFLIPYQPDPQTGNAMN